MGNRSLGKATGSIHGLNTASFCLAGAVLNVGPSQVSGFSALQRLGVMKKCLEIAFTT